MTSIGPAKGSDDDRRRWMQWVSRGGLTETMQSNIRQRRGIFRSNLSEKDKQTFGRIEQSLINMFHPKNAMTERWPKTIRVMLNDTGENEPRPFESWVGPPGLQKRIQATRVWTDLIQFVVMECHINRVTWPSDEVVQLRSQSYLTDMGFVLSEESEDDILDLVNSTTIFPEHLQANIQEFLLRLIMQENPTPKNNLLLFWVNLLLETEEFGNQPRLEFSGVKDSLTMREKLEALVHYARVLLLDNSFMGTWGRNTPVPKEYIELMNKALNRGDYRWCDRGETRPADQEEDPADFSQPYWQDFKAHFDEVHKKWLVKGSNSPIGVILSLL